MRNVCFGIVLASYTNFIAPIVIAIVRCQAFSASLTNHMLSIKPNQQHGQIISSSLANQQHAYMLKKNLAHRLDLIIREGGLNMGPLYFDFL